MGRLHVVDEGDKQPWDQDEDELVTQEVVLQAENPHADTWVHLLEPSAGDDLEHFLVISEVFIKTPDLYEDRKQLERWGDRTLNILSISEIRVVVESRHHWRIEIEVTSAGGLIPVLQTIVLFKVEWLKMFPEDSWRTDRVTTIRL